MPEETSLTELMTMLVFQVSVIIIVAKAFGYIATHFLKQSSVLGELFAGMLVGPYALGGLPLPFLGHQALFTVPVDSFLPVSSELNGFATIASIVLLFMSGLETDLKTFLRFAGVGALVGFGGFLFSFFLGAGVAVLFLPDVSSLFEAKALFLGISSSTSIGITARILTEKRRLSSPEGVTILSAAVFDDVLGIIALAIVFGLVSTAGHAGNFQWGSVGILVLKAFGFWIISTVLGIILAPRLTRGLKTLKDMEVLALCSFGLALMLAGASEVAGLAMVIGAYVMGLALSSTDVAEVIRSRLEGLYSFFVPLFFCVMGMMVDFSILNRVAAFGCVFIAISILGKIFGAGAVSLLGGFNFHGAFRIGAGMMPRGEVSLVIAGLGLSSGVLDSALFGVIVMLVFVSCLFAPPVILHAFSGADGFKGVLKWQSGTSDRKTISFAMPTEMLADSIVHHFITAFKRAGFFPRRLNAQKSYYMLQKDKVHIVITRESRELSFIFPPDQISFVQILIAEEILSFKNVFKSIDKIVDSDNVERAMVNDLFGAPASLEKNK